jgi:PAS domain S-box-containing protein
MSEKRRLLTFVAVMSFVVLVASGASIYLSYHTGLDQQATRLSELAQGQAQMIEALARSSSRSHLENHLGTENAEAATLTQIIEAYSGFEGFSRTGQFTVARREGDNIIFLLGPRRDDLEKPKSVPFNAKTGEPMRRALSGESGTVVALGYRGEPVLAAYAPVTDLGMGAIAQIGLAEIRAPFVKASILAGGVAIIAILCGTLGFVRLVNPKFRKLAAGGERYRHLLEHMGSGLAVIDPGGAIDYANRRLGEMWGYRPDELIGHTLADFLAGGERPALLEDLTRREKDECASSKVTFAQKGGRKLTVVVTRRPIFDVNGAFQGTFAVFTDITEIEGVEQDLGRVNRALRMLSDCNQILIRAENESALLQQVCEAIVRTGGYRFVCVGLPGEGPEKTAKSVAQAGDEEGDGEAGEKRTWALSGDGPAGAAIHTGKPVVARDITADPRFAHWREKALAQGWRSSIALPLSLTGGIYGTLSIYANTTDAFDEEEVKLLASLADDLDHGLNALRIQAERGKAEAGLRESEYRFRELFNQVTSGVAIYEVRNRGKDFIIQDFNRAAERITGVSKSAVLGRNLTELFPGVEEFGLLDVFRRVWETGSPEKHPLTFYHDQRLSFWAENTVYRLPSGEVVAVFDDVTEKKRAEQASKEAHETLMTVLEGMMADVYAADLETHEVLYANKNLRESFSHELIGRRCYEVFRSESSPCIQCTNASLVDEQGQPTEGCVWTGQNPITERWYLNYDRAVRWVNGRLVRLQVATDITEARKAAEETKRLEAKFLQAQKLEAVGRLAGGIAHDFKNLMTTVIGYSDLLLMRSSPDDFGHEELQEIKKAGNRAASLTHQLLAFSRKQSLEPKVLDLNEVIRDMEKMLRPLIGEDVDLKMLLEPTLGMVKVDPVQMEQVIMNLAVNSRDAMPQGGKFWIKTENVVVDERFTKKDPTIKPGPYVQLTVADTGVGIKNEDMPHVFEPFFTTKEEEKGTGLGLATVYGIVTQSGGHIYVDSEPGQGAAFKIYLPRTEDAEKVVPVQVSDGGSGRGSETILVVEDEEVVRNLIQRVLQSKGYEVLAAGNGEEALKLSAQHAGPIHLLLTDVVMPEMNGRELAERFRSSRPDALVLYMSGYLGDTRAQGGSWETSGVRILEKPFSYDDLLSTVRVTLHTHPGTAE